MNGAVYHITTPPGARTLDPEALANVLANTYTADDRVTLAAIRRAVGMLRAANVSWKTALGIKEPFRQQAGLPGLQVLITPYGLLVPPVGLTWKDSAAWLLNHRASAHIPEVDQNLLVRLRSHLTRQYAPGAPWMTNADADRVIGIYDAFMAAGWDN